MTAQNETARCRLYLEQGLGQGQEIDLSRDHVHYLFNVLRLSQGQIIAVFNGRDGEWQARIDHAGKRAGRATCLHQSAEQRMPPDLWLIFCPIKKARTDFIVEKAAELGVARILPVHSDRTNSERIRRDRLQAHAIEAAEQCGGTHVPDVAEMRPLSQFLDGWPAEGRALIWADEESASTGAAPGLHATPLPPAPAAILIGPEGGFSPAERTRLRGLANVWPIALGPRILRADTAAVAALTLWQSRCGDWGRS